MLEKSMDGMVGHETAGKEIEKIHDLILSYTPKVSRVACVLWNEASDDLYTYVNSTREGTPIEAYKFPLKSSKSLSALARSGEYRYIANIRNTIEAGRQHSNWLLEQGYNSSMTVPMHQGKRFLGFVFFNSNECNAFDEKIQKELLYYAELISANVSKIQIPVFLFVSVLNLHDYETENHVNRMAAYSYIIASKLVKKGIIDDELAANIHIFSPLHDIGKVKISEDLLLKEGPLTETEFAEIKEHVDNGLKMVTKFEEVGVFPTSAFNVLKNIIGQHHEKMDGSGYPLGLRSDEISIEGKIVAVADIFDALTSRRSYKRAWTNDEALVELKRLANENKISSQLVDILEESMEEVVALQKIYKISQHIY